MRRSWPEDVVRGLRCPLCGSGLADDGDRLGCVSGHSFDRARQGFVTLRDGHAAGVQADSAAMVAARERVLGSGAYQPLSEDLARTVARVLPGGDEGALVVDLAGGTGHHLAAVLDACPGAWGLDLDLSSHALRRAARLHPRMFAVGADLLRPLPVADGAAACVTSVFGPRPAGEIDRILAPGARLVVAVPTPAHLAEIVEPMGMIHVDEVKEHRLAERLPLMEVEDRHHLRFEVPADRALVRDIVAMGPSAHHVTEAQLDERTSRLGAVTAVHADLTILVLTRRGVR